eukprot:2178838-Pyramimonas_sp.AAC.1
MDFALLIAIIADHDLRHVCSSGALVEGARELPEQVARPLAQVRDAEEQLQPLQHRLHLAM